MGMTDRASGYVSARNHLGGIKLFLASIAPAMMSKTTNAAGSHVLMIDDHALFRGGLSLIISTHPLVSKVYEAESVMAAARSDVKSINLILLDIYMPGVKGLDGIAMLRSKYPEAAIAIVSSSGDFQDVKAAQHQGANGFMFKTDAPSDFHRAVSALLRGNEWFPQDRHLPAPTEDSDDKQLLTGRQMQELGHLFEGLSNRAIALRRHISENTVRTHVRGVLQHFAANSRAEAVVMARKQGIVQ